MKEHLGTLEEGKMVHLIAVKGDPLEDIFLLKDVKMVIQGGQAVS